MCALPAQAAAGAPGAAVPAGSDAATAAVEEVSDAFCLLARLTAAEPAIALQLAQIQVSWGARRGGGGEGSEEGSEGEGDHGGYQPQADLVALVGAAVAVLTRLPQPPIEALGALRCPS